MPTDKEAMITWITQEIFCPREIKAIERKIRSEALDRMVQHLMAKWHLQA